MSDKKKVLAFWGGHHESNVLDLALDHVNNGDEVLLLCCDKSEEVCIRNYRECQLYCEICKKSKKEILHKYAKGFNNSHFISEYLNDEIKKISEDFEFKYNSTKELKDITFHGVEIGFGAFSTYVTLTRHCNPLYTEQVKSYLNDMMRSEIRLILIAEKAIKEFNPNLIIFHNGRFAQYKPLLGLAQKLGIEYIASEWTISSDKEELHNDFYNDIPHSTTSFQLGIERDWNRAEPEERVRIAKQFYENRRNARPAGDVVYTQNQQIGLLPDNWDSSKYNIVIFNSSEDEFVSISKEYDKGQLFESQYVALNTILHHYKNDSSMHIYLRIHPNLGDVDDISHLALYNLKYPNFTIIPPKSPISTYTLLDNANKIIVFNSTVGVEAAYWGKTVISLNMCAYDAMDVTYRPQTVEEMFSLIENKELVPKYNEGALKYAYYLLQVNYPKQNNFQNYWRERRILGVVVEKSKIFTLFGSNLLYAFANFIVNRIPLHSKPFAKYCKVPNDRDLWSQE